MKNLMELEKEFIVDGSGIIPYSFLFYDDNHTYINII